MMTVMAVFAGCGSDTGETGASDAQAVGDTAETDAETKTAEDTVLRVLEINMGEDKTVTDAMYDDYFEKGNAEDGVKEVLAAGNFYINGFAIPETEEALESE